MQTVPSARKHVQLVQNVGKRATDPELGETSDWSQHVFPDCLEHNARCLFKHTQSSANGQTKIQRKITFENALWHWQTLASVDFSWTSFHLFITSKTLNQIHCPLNVATLVFVYCQCYFPLKIIVVSPMIDTSLARSRSALKNHIPLKKKNWQIKPTSFKHWKWKKSWPTTVGKIPWPTPPSSTTTTTQNVGEQLALISHLSFVCWQDRHTNWPTMKEEWKKKKQNGTRQHNPRRIKRLPENKELAFVICKLQVELWQKNQWRRVCPSTGREISVFSKELHYSSFQMKT